MCEIPPSPDDEADVDREIRIEKMRRELDDLAGGSMISGGFGDVPPTIEEAFLSRACAFERAKLDTNFNRLVQHGIAMEPPDELDDAMLSAKLQDMLRILEDMHCFVEQTDHLSDRELYTWLWTDGLREETPDLAELGGAWHTSPIGSCDDEDTVIFLSTTRMKMNDAAGMSSSQTTSFRHTSRCRTIGTGICRAQTFLDYTEPAVRTLFLSARAKRRGQV